jgi:hypothetical protein
MSLRRVALPATVAVAAIALSACGGSDNATPRPGQPHSAQQANSNLIVLTKKLGIHDSTDFTLACNPRTGDVLYIGTDTYYPVAISPNVTCDSQGRLHKVNHAPAASTPTAPEGIGR